ncbi:ABC transporter ATP-binding protein [Homoserinimonas sp. OAct 916]|uniref:ABC transporter ATP-binding protein n=1 Tax=Homoserinimonas sp. OAct 916 TaxID=2211450 RepID=UPI000DBE6D85|nr:ABC transporter ATP-binding protein [Homoserinimonas sp. OAct 916]
MTLSPTRPAPQARPSIPPAFPQPVAAPDAAGLSARRISFSRQSTLIIDGVDCTVPVGGFAAVIGPNGAGKSTLLQVIAGILPASESATARLGDTDLVGMRRRDRARIVALAEQHSAEDSGMRVSDVVMLGRTPHLGRWQAEGAEDKRIVQDALEAVSLREFADRAFDTLSGGERQRVHLARALAQQPRLLLLDEPTNHLDVHAQLSLLSLVRAQTASGLTVVAALHDLNIAVAYADHVIVLKAGRVRAAGPAQQVLTPELIWDVYGVRAEILTNPITGRPLIAFDTGDRPAS